MKHFAVWVFFIALFLIFLLPPTDPDLGWQLKCGELFWQEQSFCEDNQFSVLLENYSWPNHAWGYQALIYKIHQFFGIHGLTVFNALLMTAAFGFLFAAYRCSSAIHCALGILATIYFGWGVFSFGPRSQLVGFFFFTLTLYLLTKIEVAAPTDVGARSDATARPWRASPFFRNYLALPLTMLLWANTHGSVILGLILMGVFNLSYLTATVGKRERNSLLLTATAISGLITLINPFGFRIYEEAWRHFFGPIDLSKLIAEWVPPQPHIQQIILISGTAVFLYVLFKLVCTSELQFALPALFLIPIFTFWALKARRNVPFHFVVISYSLLNSLKTKMSPLRNQLAALLAVGVLLYGLIIQLPQTIEYDPCQRDVPCGAVEFLKKQEPGPIFNRYEWGGFLIWQLPEYKIFVDGRMPAWRDATRSLGEGWADKSPYTIYLETLQTRPGWQETLDKHDIIYILISPNTFMDLKLRPDPASLGWSEIFRDRISVVYKKTLN